MQKFKTLLLREWMQHQRGWLVMLALPFTVIVLAALFGQFQVDLGEGESHELPPPLAMALMAVVGTGGLTLTLACLSALLQAPGLARRDVQDRSIEFWLSLPTSHVQSLGAQLGTHLVLWPCLALVVGMTAGVVASLFVVAKFAGIGAWLALPWLKLLPVLLLVMLRLLLGLTLAVLWLSPLILGTMAASAWLKRWGVPLVVGGLVVSGLLLDRLYGNPVVQRTLKFLAESASQALIAVDRSGHGPKGLAIHPGEDVDAALSVVPGWLLHDAGQALAMLATPGFVAVLAASALAFGLLVLRRQRGA